PAGVVGWWGAPAAGIKVRLYPWCRGTHPTTDASLDLRRGQRFTADDVERIEVHVDSIVPTILIHDRPSTGLEGKFSMRFCAAAAAADGHVGVETFDDARLRDPAIVAGMERVVMTVDPTLDGIADPLTQARGTVRLRGGRTLTRTADGARGYPKNPASAEDLSAKFLACARQALPEAAAARALERLQRLEALADVRELTSGL